MQVEQAAYYILESALTAQNPPTNVVAKGRVLNVGLGPGLSARMFLMSRYITATVSVELQQSVIDAYRAQFPVNAPMENRHTIVQGHAATVPANLINPPFDWVFIDTITTTDDFTFNDLKTIMTRLAGPGALVAPANGLPGGGVTIQHSGDTKPERNFRNWLEDNGWVKVVSRAELADFGQGRAAEMTVYYPGP